MTEEPDKEESAKPSQLDAGSEVQQALPEADETAKTAPRRDYLWKKGQSGNPKGRPQGSRNKATLAIEALLDAEGESLTRKCIEMAQGGDGAAMRLVLERIVSPRKDRPIKFELPPIESAADAAAASATIISGVAAGEITPSEAEQLSKILDTHVRLLEANNFEARIARLEQNNSSAIL